MSTAEPTVSHRERKKQATRRAIHDAAFDLVERHGLSGTTIEAISERAGVAPRTFWSYFASKEDAVVNRDQDAIGALADAVRGRPADEDALTALRVVLSGYMGVTADSGRSIRRQKLIRRSPPLMAAVAAMFDEWERGLVAAVAFRLAVDPDDDLMPGVLVAAACATCRVAQHRWAEDDGRRPVAEVLDEAFEQLGRCMVPLVRQTAGRRRR